jgi:myo-inositol-1(or 4)-monophosphatase
MDADLSLRMLKQTLLKATEAAAAIIKESFNTSFQVSSKSSANDLVTEIDKKSEAAIIDIIRQDYPDHYILTEESGDLPQNSAYKWIIDPIDGTINFANNIPICCVSIGLEVDGHMEMGAVYNPFLNELFFAQRGFGATLNDQLISVSKKDAVSTSCLATGFPYRYINQENGPLQVFDRLIRKGIPVRRLGSAAIDLCWVAAGRFDGFYEHHLNAWDSAAGFLIVEEAGGKVTDLKGNPYNPYEHGIIATNGLIHDELKGVVNNEIQL